MEPTTSPAHSAPVDGTWSASRESRKTGERKRSSQVVTPGMKTTPPTIESTASGPMAARIAPSRSAMWCSGPGNPTSASSRSPVAGLKCSPCQSSPFSRDAACSTGSPRKTRNTIRKA